MQVTLYQHSYPVFHRANSISLEKWMVTGFYWFQGSAITLPSQSQADCVNAAAAVAQSAIQQVQAAKEIKKQVGVRVVFVFACSKRCLVLHYLALLWFWGGG